MENKTEQKPISLQGLLPLFVVYLVWGSTYLAIRITVREGGGFPPFTLALIRVGTAGLLLLAWSWLRKFRLRPTKSELFVLAASGLLLMTGGNGVVVWAEQRAESTMAALLVAAAPIWTAIIEAVIDRKMPSGKLLGALLVGFCGLAVLAVPGSKDSISSDLWSNLGLLFAGFSWSLGSVLQSRRPVSLRPLVSSGYQMIFGSIGLLILMLLLGEPAPQPSTEAWLALVYLVIFGSILAFTSYVTALKTLPIKIVMTYTYVNPVIALLLGWAILGERITWWMIAGMGLVLLGVWGVFRERYGAAPDEAQTSPTSG
jgi:drug/metabolite transporter (DMT)-like permease